MPVNDYVQRPETIRADEKHDFRTRECEIKYVASYPCVLSEYVDNKGKVSDTRKYME